MCLCILTIIMMGLWKEVEMLDEEPMYIIIRTALALETAVRFMA